MAETRWTLRLEDKASAAARRIARDLRAMSGALQMVKDLGPEAAKALASVGGGDTSRRLRAQTGLIREQTRALREQRAVQAQRVREDRAAGRLRERQTKQQLSAHAAVANLNRQREAREARARREADGHFAQYQRAERATAQDRERQAGQRARREDADRRLADRHFAEVQRNERRQAADRARAQSEQHRRDDANRRMADRHFAQVQRGERVGAQQQARLNGQAFRRDQREAAQQQRARERGEANAMQRIARLNAGAFKRDQREAANARRASEREAAQHQRANTRRNESLARSPLSMESITTVLGPRAAGILGAFGMAATAAAALAAAVYAVGSAMVSITQTTLELVGTLAGIALEIGQVVFALGHSVLQLIAFREGALMTLATLARTDGEGMRAGETPEQNARRVRAQREQQSMRDFNWSQDFARRTPLNMTQVVEMQTQAAAAGYQGSQRREMVAAAADAAALHPNDASTGSRFLLQMGQLRNSAVARSADYRPAAQAAGINETAAMRRAAIAAGVVQRGGESESAYQRRIRTAQGNGQITGRQMHDAILDEQRAQLGGGESGSFARSQAGSMAAVLSNLGEGFQSFVTSLNAIENLKGVQALKAMLTQIADTLAGATENGQFLQTVFGKLLDFGAGSLGGMFGPGGFDGALTGAIATVREFLPLLTQLATELRGGFMEGIQPMIVGAKQAGGVVGGLRGVITSIIPDARGFARGLGTIAVFMLRITRATVQAVAALISAGRFLPDLEAGLRGAANPIAMILNGLNLARAGAGNAVNGAIRDAILPPGTRRRAVADWLGIGRDMGNGVAQGFRERQGHMQSEVSSVMASLPATARTDMQIKSPSRVFAEIGQYMAEGVTVGLDSGAGGVQSAMSNVVAPPSLGRFGGGVGGGASVTIDVGGIHIDGAQDAGAVVEELRTKVEEIFAGLLERVQLAGGA